MESNLFWWESQDGSRVMTFRIPFSYNNWSPRNYEDSVYGKALEVMEMAEAHKHNLMCFFGVGNHGGGPTIANVQSILRLQREHDKQIYRFSSPNEYFMEMENSYPELPVFTDDLQHHASGCYSAHSETKALNRKAEHRLLSAEKFSTLSHAIASFHYPESDIRRGWNNVMFNHFHDILGGCSIREAYDDAREAYGESLHLAAVSINAALQKISWSIDTMKDEIQSLSKDKDWVLWEQKDAGIPVVVFNPLSWEIEAPIQINKKVKGVTDDRGVSVEFQTVRGSRTNGSDDKYDTVFMGRIPALGYRVYWIYKEKVFSTPSPGRMLSVEEHALENDWYRLEIDAQTGHIRRLMDKKKGVEVFEGRSAVPIVIDEEHCDTWAHGVFDFRNEIGVFGNASIRLLEAGPLRAVLRVTNRYNGSSLRQDFILYRDKPNIEVRVKLDWHERHKMLKLSFPVAVDGPIATYEIPYGYLERETNGEEEPGQQWVDVTGKPKNRDIETYGVTLINDSKYSFDVKNNDLRMTVVRSPIFADHYGERDEFCEYMDQGVQEFLYALVPHEGDWRKGKAPMNSYELNVPPVTIIETYHKGTLPQTLEGVKITADNLIVTAFKKAESGDGYILRCYETDGRDGRTEIELPFLNRRWTMAYGKCEIKTVWIPADSTKEIVEVNMIEMQM